LKRCKVSLQVGVAFDDSNMASATNFRQLSKQAIITATLSANSSSSIDNRNLNVFPYKLNLFTKLVYEQSAQR